MPGHWGSRGLELPHGVASMSSLAVIPLPTQEQALSKPFARARCSHMPWHCFGYHFPEGHLPCCQYQTACEGPKGVHSSGSSIGDPEGNQALLLRDTPSGEGREHGLNRHHCKGDLVGSWRRCLLWRAVGSDLTLEMICGPGQATEREQGPGGRSAFWACLPLLRLPALCPALSHWGRC